MPHPDERQPSWWLDDPDDYPETHNDDPGSDQEPDYEDLIEPGLLRLILSRKVRPLASPA